MKRKLTNLVDVRFTSYWNVVAVFVFFNTDLSINYVAMGHIVCLMLSAELV